MDKLECDSNMVGDEIVIVTSNQTTIHFRLDEVKRHKDGTQFLVHLLRLKGAMLDRVILEEHGAIACADRPGMQLSDINKEADILPYAGVVIAPGYLGLLKIKGEDAWPFEVAQVTTL